MCDYPAGSWPLLQDNSIGQEGHLRESYGDTSSKTGAYSESGISKCRRGIYN